MINKIIYKSKNNEREISVGRINILYTTNENQSGKTTTLETIPFTFQFNSNYFNDQLNFSGSEDISSIVTSLVIENKIFTHERERSEGILYKASNKTIVKDLSGNKIKDFNVGKSKLKENNYLEIPTSFKASAISRKHNYIQEIEHDSFSFGLYYQLFYIDEKIGWYKYFQPKVIGSFDEYSKDRINLYLFGLIGDKAEIDSKISELEKYSSTGDKFVDDFLAKRFLEGRKKYIETTSIEKAIKFTLTEGDRKEIESFAKINEKILRNRDRAFSVKKNLELNKNSSDTIKSIISVSMKKFGNVFDMMNMAELNKNFDESVEEQKNKLKLLDKDFRDLKEKRKEIEGNLDKIIQPLREKFTIEDFAKNYEFKKEKPLIDEMIQEIKDSSPSRGREVSSALNEIHNINKLKISKHQKEILKLLIDKLRKYIEKNDIKAEKELELLEGMKEMCSNDNYYAKGSLENIQILSERLAIIKALNKEIKIPFFVVDSPYKAETTNSNAAESNNIMRFLTKELLILLMKECENGKIKQIFISSADIDDDLQEFKNIFKNDINEIKFSRGIFGNK